jgi:hypothetical protein
MIKYEKYFERRYGRNILLDFQPDQAKKSFLHYVVIDFDGSKIRVS